MEGLAGVKQYSLFVQNNIDERKWLYNNLYNWLSKYKFFYLITDAQGK